MARNWFVEPETAKLDLSGDGWIEVKRRLTYGEQQRLAGGAMRQVTGRLGEEMKLGLDLETYSILRLVTWIVDWNACDAQGKHVPISKDTVGALDPAMVDEIDEVLTVHILEGQREKKLTSPG